jgi:hypothetical protein
MKEALEKAAIEWDKESPVEIIERAGSALSAQKGTEYIHQE